MTRKWLVLVFGFIVVVCVVVFVLITGINREKQEEQSAQLQPLTDIVDEEPRQNVPEEPVAEFDAISIQKRVDAWVSDLPTNSEASVQVLDADGVSLAAYTPEEEYTAASMYKLFVAYLGYGRIDSGDMNPKEPYTTTLTRAECLDVMIRNSENVCAEKMWNEFNKREQNAQLEKVGIKDTNMVMTTTTATDAAKLLQLVSNGRGLSSDSRTAFMDSLLNQPDFYRRGLPSGFSDEIMVYNKVGFNEQNLWHDSAIIEFEDGRQLTVSVFTKDVGYEKVAELGAAIEKVVLAQ